MPTSRLVVGVFLSTIASISAVISGLIWKEGGQHFILIFWLHVQIFIAKYTFINVYSYVPWK